MINKNLARIDFSKRFDKQLKHAPLEIQKSFRNKFALFLQNQFHPQLNNHALTGKLKDRRSINITGDWRAIYSSSDGNGNHVILFEILGTHSQLYK
jgi:addiction module RelE/StbE family toxin